MRTTIVRTCSLLTLALISPHFAGCDKASSTVNGMADIGRRGQGLQLGTFLKVNGQYEDNKCIDPAMGNGAKRASGSPWSTDFGSSAGLGPMVVLGDSGCKLDITSLEIQDSLGNAQLATPSTPLALGSTYLGTPAAFSYTDAGTMKVLEFYANAKIAPADFSADFGITVLYSDSPSDVTAPSLSGQYATTAASSVANGNVPQPNGALSFSSVSYAKDAMNVVTAVSGDPTLSLGSVPGQNYVIAAGSCPSALAAINAAYGSGTQLSVATALTSSSLGLAAGTDLSMPLAKCLITANCDMASWICSYQLFDITFN